MSEIERALPSLVRLALFAAEVGAGGQSIRRKWAGDGAFLRLQSRDRSIVDRVHGFAAEIGFRVHPEVRDPDGVWQVCIEVPNADLEAARPYGNIVDAAGRGHALPPSQRELAR